MSIRREHGHAVIITIFLLLAISLSGTAQAQVVLSEVLADPVSDWSGDGIIDFKNDEWVEIQNTGDSPVQITDYWISDSLDDPVYRYSFSGTLGANEALHVTGAMALAWQAEYGMGSGALSLSNSGGVVALFRDVAGSTEFVDSIEYLSYQIDDDRSLGRVPQNGGSWILFDGLNIYHGNQEPGSTGCLPSPGEVNVCDVVSTHESNWGAIKRSFSND